MNQPEGLESQARDDQRAAAPGMEAGLRFAKDSSKNGIPESSRGSETSALETHDRIRAFQDEDEAEVIGVWFRSGKAAYPYLANWRDLTLELATDVFQKLIRPWVEIWVGVQEDRIVAFLAMEGACIDRLYIDPQQARQGWGSRFVELAKQRCPEGLKLFTHQENHVARRFYEKHGFQAVAFGISPPPESAPDVEYRWLPASG